MAHPPSAELVATAWLKTLPGIPESGVATSLPGDPASWSTNGFIQVVTVGGTPPVDTPMRTPVVQVSCWANNPGSAKTPWRKASVLAENVVAGCYADTQQRQLPMPDGYRGARIHAVWPISEPRRIPQDEAGFARVDVDLAVTWVTL